MILSISRHIQCSADLTRWYAKGGKPLLIRLFACQYPIIMYARKRPRIPKKILHLTIWPVCRAVSYAKSNSASNTYSSPPK